MVPMWEEMSPARRAWEAVGGAVVWGVVTGLLLDTSSALYFVAVAIAAAGGAVGGSQHRTTGDALKRALAGGTLYGLGVLLGHAIAGGDAKVDLPDPAIAYLLFTIVPAVPLHLLGRWLRARRV